MKVIAFEITKIHTTNRITRANFICDSPKIIFEYPLTFFEIND